MATESFNVRGAPKTVAHKALGLIKRARLPKFKLTASGVTQDGDGFTVSARWKEDAAFFAGSAELRVQAQRGYSGTTQVVITADGERVAALAARLRRSL